ncbi:hypothetical protein BC332_23909 [Capsicum chinense]|nr:hypothetical protein BC332_23909 [Capsicum chinense]
MGIKFEIEKFDGRINFGLWQVQVKDVLIQSGLHKALKERPTSGKGDKDSEKFESSEDSEKSKISDEEWEELDMKAASDRLSRADSSMDTKLFNSLRKTCASGGDPSVFLDQNTYLHDASDKSTAGIVANFTSNPTAFQQALANALIKLGGNNWKRRTFAKLFCQIPT